jgi:hypothetical protein
MFTQWAASSTATIWAWGTSALAFCALLYGKLTSCLPVPPQNPVQRTIVYHHGSRIHLALGKDTQDLRPRESADEGKVIALPMVGGMHHRYTRRAA